MSVFDYLAEIDIGICRVCRCTDYDPCIDPEGHPCGWFRVGLCTLCAADAIVYGQNTMRGLLFLAIARRLAEDGPPATPQALAFAGCVPHPRDYSEHEQALAWCGYREACAAR